MWSTIRSHEVGKKEVQSNSRCYTALQSPANCSLRTSRVFAYFNYLIQKRNLSCFFISQKVFCSMWGKKFSFPFKLNEVKWIKPKLYSSISVQKNLIFCLVCSERKNLNSSDLLFFNLPALRLQTVPIILALWWQKSPINTERTDSNMNFNWNEWDSFLIKLVSLSLQTCYFKKQYY